MQQNEGSQVSVKQHKTNAILDKVVVGGVEGPLDSQVQTICLMAQISTAIVSILSDILMCQVAPKHLFTCPPRRSMHMPMRMSALMSMHMSMQMSMHMSIRRSVHTSMYMSIHTSVPI